MLNFGNKEFRNLQEQVEKNKDDIQSLLKGGLKISCWLTESQLTDFIKEENVGKWVVVTKTSGKHLYLITKRSNDGLIAVDFGIYPAVVEGPQGEEGEPGQKGDRGASVFGTSQELPSPNAYIEGDFYLLNSGLLYKKVNGRWLPQTSLKGPQGLMGPSGSTVTANPVQEAQDDITKIEIDGVVYNVQTPLSPEVLAEVIEGSETIVVDVNQEGDKLQVRLDADVIAKLARALVVPLLTPQSKQFVGVDTENSQFMVNIGAGLELVGSTSPYTLSISDYVPVTDGENVFDEKQIFKKGFTTQEIQQQEGEYIETNVDEDFGQYIAVYHHSGSVIDEIAAFTKNALLYRKDEEDSADQIFIIKWKDIATKESVITITTATHSGALASHNEYKFTNANFTSLSITGLTTQTGDNVPKWHLKFKVGSGFTFTSTPTLNWRNGQPTWSDFVGQEVELLIEQSLTSGTYNIWVI